MSIPNEPGASHPVTVWSVGHGRASLDQLSEILNAASIKILVDVRSVPYSRHVPHASREPLKSGLEARGFEYVYLGDRLGGIPTDPDLLNSQGRPNYGKIAESARFKDGISCLLSLAAARRTCMMCSEEDPAHCHRSRLITPVLLEAGVAIQHLRHDGRILPHESLF